MEKYSTICFDWEHERVTRGDIVVRISGQEKILLRLMVEGADALCTKEVLMDAIWGHRASLIDELYLTQLVYRLRKSLRPLDLADHIETVPRAGYRFVAGELRCSIDGSAEGPMPEPTPADGAMDDELCRPPPGYSSDRRWGASSSSSPQQFELPSIDAARGIVSHGGATAHLTRFEQTLLQTLVEHADATLTRETLMKKIWGDEEGVSFNRLTRLVSRLRRSLAPLGLKRHVVFVPSVGYRFCCTTTPRDTRATKAAHVVMALNRLGKIFGRILPVTRWSESAARWRRFARPTTPCLIILIVVILIGSVTTLKLIAATDVMSNRNSIALGEDVHLVWPRCSS